MNGKLHGKIAIVTGGAGGIGSAISHKFASEGASVVLVDLNKEELNVVYESLTKEYGDKHFQVCGDVSDSKFAKALFMNVQEKYNENASVLVNCAGIARPSFFIDSTEEGFDDTIRINLKSVYVMTKIFVDNLKTENKDQLKSGSIINIASIAAKVGIPRLADYAASKSGMIGLSKTIGVELGKFGIRCNVVLPGLTSTPMLDATFDKEELLQMEEEIPMKRLGKPKDIANLCSFLASDESSYINSACIDVTGGFKL